MSIKVMLEVLNKAADDIQFYKDLAEKGSVALKGFKLNMDEKAAIVTGDQRFIESRLGRKVDRRIQAKVLIPLTSRERW